MALFRPTVRVRPSEFQSTIQRYAKYTKRDWSTVSNTKGFYISRRAVRETAKANKAAMVAELKSARFKKKTFKTGTTRTTRYTLAEFIIMARQKAALPRREIKALAKKLIEARKRSINFLRSGYIPAIKRLEPLAAKTGKQPPRVETAVKQVGRAKGNADPARVGSFRAVCRILNDALTKKRKNQRGTITGGNRDEVLAIAEPALQRAFDAETQSMKDYIEKKLAQSAKRAGIKVAS